MPKKPNVSITVRTDERIEKALRRFARACQRAGIASTLRRKRYHEKPSDERRRKLRKQERNRRRAERKAQQRAERRWQRLKKRTRTLGRIQPRSGPQAGTTSRQAETTQRQAG
jgi:small subunit ribosomal protein S21